MGIIKYIDRLTDDLVFLKRSIVSPENIYELEEVATSEDSKLEVTALKAAVAEYYSFEKIVKNFHTWDELKAKAPFIRFEKNEGRFASDHILVYLNEGKDGSIRIDPRYTVFDDEDEIVCDAFDIRRYEEIEKEYNSQKDDDYEM